MSGAHGRQELPCNSRVGMSPIGSYVGGLTSKGQVGVLLGEHRGWMLHMAFLYKAKNIAYNSTLSYALTYSNQLSTICAADGPPFLSRKELRFAIYPLVSFRILAFSYSRRNTTYYRHSF